MSIIGPTAIIAGILLLALIFIGLAILGRVATNRGDNSLVVRVTFVGAAIWVVICVIGATFTTIAVLHSGSDTEITFPVYTFWPELPDAVHLEGMTAELHSGGFTEITGTVSGLSLGTRITWAISQAFGWMLPGAIAALIAVACRQLLQGKPFAPIISRVAMITAVIVAAGGFLAQVLGDIAGSMASREVLEWTGGGYEGDFGVADPIQAWWPEPTFTVELPFWPLAAGLAFAVLAGILRHGAKLQRDTEGLV